MATRVGVEAVSRGGSWVRLGSFIVMLRVQGRGRKIWKQGGGSVVRLLMGLWMVLLSDVASGYFELRRGCCEFSLMVLQPNKRN